MVSSLPPHPSALIPKHIHWGYQACCGPLPNPPGPQLGTLGGPEKSPLPWGLLSPSGPELHGSPSRGVCVMCGSTSPLWVPSSVVSVFIRKVGGRFCLVQCCVNISTNSPDSYYTQTYGSLTLHSLHMVYWYI